MDLILCLVKFHKPTLFISFESICYYSNISTLPICNNKEEFRPQRPRILSESNSYFSSSGIFST